MPGHPPERGPRGVGGAGRELPPPKGRTYLGGSCWGGGPGRLLGVGRVRVREEGPSWLDRVPSGTARDRDGVLQLQVPPPGRQHPAEGLPLGLHPERYVFQAAGPGDAPRVDVPTGGTAVLGLGSAGLLPRGHHVALGSVPGECRRSWGPWGGKCSPPPWEGAEPQVVRSPSPEAFRPKAGHPGEGTQREAGPGRLTGLWGSTGSLIIQGSQREQQNGSKGSSWLCPGPGPTAARRAGCLVWALGSAMATQLGSAPTSPLCRLPHAPGPPWASAGQVAAAVPSTAAGTHAAGQLWPYPSGQRLVFQWGRSHLKPHSLPLSSAARGCTRGPAEHPRQLCSWGSTGGWERGAHSPVRPVADTAMLSPAL